VKDQVCSKLNPLFGETKLRYLKLRVLSVIDVPTYSCRRHVIINLDALDTSTDRQTDRRMHAITAKQWNGLK